MGWVIAIVSVVMVIYSFIAAGAEDTGNQKKEEAVQGAVSTGWIILVIIGITVLARGCQ